MKNLLVIVVGLLTPIEPMLVAALVLILADLIAGIVAAIKQKQSITSAGLRRTIVKIVVYEVAIVLAYVAQTYLIANMLPLMNIVTAYIGMTEILSIFENLNIISGSVLLKTLLEKLNSANNSNQQK